MSTLKVTILALAIPFAVFTHSASADATAVTGTAVATTLSTQTGGSGCSQIEQHAGVAPAMCGTYSTTELAQMFLALSD